MSSWDSTGTRETIVVTSTLARTTGLTEAIEGVFTSAGFYVEPHAAYVVFVSDNRSRLLAHLRRFGIRIYSITTRSWA